MIKVQGKIIKTEPIQGNLIDNIEGLIKVQEKTVTPIEETQDIIPDSSYDALSRVTVNKIPDSYVIPEGTLEITSNNLYDVKNYENASVNIELKLAEKTITKNGIYDALDDSVDGYSQVTVDTPNKFPSLVDGTITTVTAEDLAGVTSIGNYAFYYRVLLTSITIPDSVTSIGAGAFQQCSGLKNILIPNNITDIAGYAFNNCSGLISVTIGDGIKSIGAMAFQSCSSVVSYTIRAINPPTLATGAFNYIPSRCKIYVPAASVNAYKSASNWSNYSTFIQAIPE